ncbi:MAG: PLP-dependent cysteine synthase family protein [Anaerolineales bacterium]|nr:PLP-dependent cysteine synthase family protein [Anaerolineales bacterium]
MDRNMKIANSMLDLIGQIPLVRLNRIGQGVGAEILVKPEFLNPSGSIKDRIARLMIEQAEACGALKAGMAVIEATTGNTGTALAFVAAVKGYCMRAFSPAMVANRSRTAIMIAFGAAVQAVDIEPYTAHDQGNNDGGGVDASVHGGHVELLPRQVCLDLEKERNDLWWARQFSNPSNVAAHRDGTAQEILDMTEGQLDAFVASVGTGGTILGVAQALKQHNPHISIIAVEPAGKAMMGDPEDYPMIPGISDGIIPQIFSSKIVDRVISITDKDAIDMAHQLAELEGMFCGMSSGANVLASTMVARELGVGKRVVTVLPDSRDRYLEVEKYTT